MGYALERLKDGAWQDIPLNGLMIKEIAMNIPAHSSQQTDYAIHNYTGDLDTGTYRLVMSVYDTKGNETVLTAEFEIN